MSNGGIESSLRFEWFEWVERPERRRRILRDGRGPGKSRAPADSVPGGAERRNLAFISKRS
jgi:hypothetical protein